MESLVGDAVAQFFHNNRELISALIPGEMKQAMHCPRNNCSKPSTSNSEEKDVINNKRSKFEANLDLKNFKPEEISVITSDNVVIVEAKQEKEDLSGSLSRHVLRRYVLSEEFDIEKVESKLSYDGILTVTAPRIHFDKEGCRVIPVIRTSQFAPNVNKDEEKKGDWEQV